MNRILAWMTIALVVLIVLMLFVGCKSAGDAGGIPVVKGFDVSRYLGTWHEIARLPKWFERDLERVTATYELDGDTLRVTNRGFRGDEVKVSTAVGHFAGPKDEGAFRISFFRPFYADYRIVWLSPEYDVAIVTGEDLSSLWILARSASIEPALRAELVERASRWGFDVSKLVYP